MKQSTRISCSACKHVTYFKHMVNDKILKAAPHFCKKCNRRLLDLNGKFEKPPTKKPIKKNPLQQEKEMFLKLQEAFAKRKSYLVDSGFPSITPKEVYKPKIDIAMTVYNTGKFFKKAIKSIATQDYDNWKLYILNDCSTDDSLEEIDKQLDNFGAKHKVKIHSLKKNCGYGRSLKDAIEMGDGELVAIIDSDDALSRKDAFSIMVEAHRLYPICSLIYSTYWACHDVVKKELIKIIVPLPENKNILDFMMSGTLKKYRASHLKVFKREAYNQTDGLDSTLRKTVDKDLVLRLEETRNKGNNYHGSLMFIDIPLYFHRKHPNSLTESYGQQGTEYIRKVQRDKARIIRNAKQRRGIPLCDKEIRREKKHKKENGQ